MLIVHNRALDKTLFGVSADRGAYRLGSDGANAAKTSKNWLRTGSMYFVHPAADLFSQSAV
jgi:hypothetical protein